MKKDEHIPSPFELLIRHGSQQKIEAILANPHRNLSEVDLFTLCYWYLKRFHSPPGPGPSKRKRKSIYKDDDNPVAKAEREAGMKLLKAAQELMAKLN